MYDGRQAIASTVCDEEGPLPPPPYSVSSSECLVVRTRYGRSTAAAVLAGTGLRPAAGLTGGFAMFDGPSGWGITPYTACHVWIDIDGYLSADGYVGRHMVGGFYSGNAFRVYSRLYREPIARGSARLERDGELFIGTGEADDGSARVRLLARYAGEPQERRGGFHIYVRPVADGAMLVRNMGTSAIYQQAEPVSVEVSAPAGSRLGLMRPGELVDAYRFPEYGATHAEPTVVSPEGNAVAAELRYILSKVTGGALVIDGDRRVVYANRAAERLFGDGVELRHGVLRASIAAADPVLERALDGSPDETNRIALARPENRWPLLISVLPLPAGTDAKGGSGGGDLKLVLLNDPAPSGDQPSDDMMRQLGLTPAEAKVAAMIGSGLSPREAAAHLGRAESTVRFTLKQVFAKLEISRQNELAAVVTRIGALQI